MDLNDLAAKLQNVKWNGQDKLTARCSSHEDVKSSLAVRQMPDRIVMHCFAGCSFDSIVSSLGLSKSDFFTTHKNGHNGSNGNGKAVLSVVDKSKRPEFSGQTKLTRYEIRDIDGALFAVHVRKDGTDDQGHKLKNLWWEQPDGKIGLNGTKLANMPLYRTETLSETHPDTTIVVTEGEKAAQSLADRGIAALGTACGAAVTPSEHVLQCLAKYPDVVLWPDNDDAGREHMSKIGSILAKSGIRSTVVQWSDAPLKGDAADFKGDRLAILQLLQSSAETLPAVQKSSVDVPAEKSLFADRQAVDAFDAWRQISGEQRTYAVAGLVKFGATAAVSGLMGAGKTTFAMNMTRAWALGQQFCGRDVVPCKVFVVASSKEYDNWAETIGKAWELQGLVYLAPSLWAHFNDTKKSAAWFAHEMTRLGCQAFVLDTLFDFFGMPPNTTGDQNRTAMNEQAPLLEVVRTMQYAGLVTGHQPKSEAQALAPRDPEEAFAGNTGWMAQHRMRISLRRKSQGANAIITGRGGYGDEGISKEQMVLFDPETRLISLGGLFSDYLGITALPSVSDALRDEGGWASRSDLEKKIGKGKAWVLAGLKEGLKREEIERKGDNRSTKYRLKGLIGAQDELL